MAALVQGYPQQQSTTVTMLQTRPSSASGMLQTSSQNQSHLQYPVNPQMQRNSFHGMNSGMVTNYRGHGSSTPIAPYAFTSTPSLSMGGQRTQNGPHLRPEQRTSSAPIIPTSQRSQSDPHIGSNRSRYPATLSVSPTSSSSSDLSSVSHKSGLSGSKDDSAISSTARVATRAPRPHSTVIISSSGPNLAPPGMSPGKSTPDRYRRPANRRTESTQSSPNSQQPSPTNSTVALPTSSAMPNVVEFYGNSAQKSQLIPAFQDSNFQIPQFSKHPTTFTAGAAADDMQLNRQGGSEQAKRYRRRSIHTIDAHDFTNMEGNAFTAGISQQGSRQVSSAHGRIDQQPQPVQQHPLRSSPIVTIRPATSHGRNDSSDSINSIRSSRDSRPSSVSYFRKPTIPPHSFLYCYIISCVDALNVTAFYPSPITVPKK